MPHQNRSTTKVIRDMSDIGDCNTGRDGQNIEATSTFHGGIASSGDSTRISAKNFENLQYEYDMRVLPETQIQHRERNQHVQELGQSSTSHMDKQLIKKQGKDTSIFYIDKSHTIVITAIQAPLNFGTEHRRNENDQMKICVAKEQGKGNTIKANIRADQQQVYHDNFPRISSNFDKQVPKANTNNVRSDLVQTYADRLRYNQAKCDVPITLTAPEITTKQDLLVVLYVKEKVMRDLAAACKYTLIGKFSNTMPKVELIRNNFILQIQLSAGVKITHFNSRHVYIDFDNELDYDMVWTKQKMSLAGLVIRIQVWTPNFKPAEETPKVPIWISLPKLPWHCYNMEFVSGQLSPIGKVLYLHSTSIKKTRVSQARVKVQVDLTQKRPYIWMGYIGEDITNGRWQKIEYDNIPDYYFYCKYQGHLESDCTIRQRDEDKKKKEMENVKNKKNKEMDKNLQQRKGQKEVDQKEGTNQEYNQQRDQEQMKYQHLEAILDKQNSPPNRQESSPSLEALDKHRGNRGKNKGKEVLTVKAHTGIDSMLPSLKPIDNVVNTIAEEAVGVEFEHSGDSRSPATPITNQQKTATQQVINTGKQQGRFNNNSGDRLSKKKGEAIKKRLKRSTGQDLDGTDAACRWMDPDNQSMDESDEDAKDTMQLIGHVFGSTFQDKCSDVQRMTEQQGLSPRGRKQPGHNPHQTINSMSNTSSRPMTRSINTKGSLERLKTLKKLHYLSIISLLEPFADISHIDMVRIQLQMDHAVSNPNGKIWLFWSNEVTGHILEKHD
ncbi:hypothetical protein H5410_056619 [Solanum commersonii]|uniref:DUF4283 domain-containing protein n=1 Tax=Solanum commersonii TaxID=4109 RepID=A0A9J5WM91_SOLCO|nr:hypothetical protein H5410_056619 [Solanum commersonii]